MNETDLQALGRRRTEIARLIEVLSAEDSELAIAQRALARLRGAAYKDISPANTPAANASKRAPAKTAKSAGQREGARILSPSMGEPKSQKELVLEALFAARPAWIDSATLRTSIQEKWGVSIPKLSLGPLLSVMKRDGLILRRGRRIAHPERGADKRSRMAA